MSNSAVRKAQRRNRSQRLVRALCILLPCALCALYLAALWRSRLDTDLLLTDPRRTFVGWEPHFAMTLDVVPPRTTSPVGPLHVLELQMARPMAMGSLTIILPVTAQTLLDLDAALSILRDTMATVAEVVILCPESLLSTARPILRNSVSSAGAYSHLRLTLQPKPVGTSEAQALIHTAAQVATDYIMFLNSDYPQSTAHSIHNMLSNPLALSFPAGVKGFRSSGFSQHDECLPPSPFPRPAAYLVPPFVVPSFLFPNTARPSDMPDTWPSFGKWVADHRPDMIGGLVFGSQGLDDQWCVAISNDTEERLLGAYIQDSLQIVYDDNVFDSPLPSNATILDTHGTFGVLLSSLDDLISFSPAICQLIHDDYNVQIFLHSGGLQYPDPVKDGRRAATITTDLCTLRYETALLGALLPAVVASTWLDSFPRPPDVVIGLADGDAYAEQLVSVIRRRKYQGTTLVHLTRADLPYSDWIGTLSLSEWKNWNVPRIDVSIITDSRPQSLARLLRSLSAARYFGDMLNLRVNVEQTADARTLQMIEDYEWEHGSVFVHHRVVHGGLLPAVVESWYPHSNDTYGLLLEDDVEVSPLFYAWAKLAILRYRYGEDKNRLPQLFGVSLYQQKNLELRPEGRQRFSARQLFSSAGLPYPNTPYLSQIPCSWGAVYFPEHWREFHAYLIARHALTAQLPLKADVVPDVRSNTWTRSWKRYYIELVFLRGYVMLYPNYAGFASLSTNHLEVGAHVRRQPRDIYDKKKTMFSLPLMGLPDENASRTLETGLLDLPDGHLPPWSALPVLDLHGLLVSEEEIRWKGEAQRSLLFGCSASAGTYNAAQLLCLDDLD